MSSNTSHSMLPPPKPPQRRFAPALALKKPVIDPHDPDSSLPENYSFVKNEVNDEPIRGTWTTIDADAGIRNWDHNHRMGGSIHDNESLMTTSSSRGKSIRSGNVWDSWAEAPTENDYVTDIDNDICGHFVEVSNLMKENRKPLTDFERRNESVLYHGNMEVMKNVIGDKIVSITHQPIDERLQYLDENGKYRDGIDRGPIKKRLMEEWHKRLADRTAEMEHIGKLKREWEGLSESEKARRVAQRQANTKLLSMFGAGLESTNDLATYEGEDLPEIYRRVSRWTISDHGSVSGGPRSRETSYSTTDRPRLDLRENAHYAGRQPSIPAISRISTTPYTDDSMSEAGFEEHNLNLYSPSRDSSLPASKLSGRISDRATILNQNNELRSRDDSYSGKNSWEPQEPRQYPLPGKRKRPNRPLSTVIPRSHPPSQPSSSIRSRLQLPPSAIESPKPATSIASENTVVFDYAPEIALLGDLPERDDFQDRWGAAAKFEKIKDASSKHGRVVMVRLHEPVLFTSSAICERLFGGGIQEIQYHPAERIALVVFLFPSEAESMVKHVKSIRENNAHEYRRLQIDVEWYKGLEIKAIYPAQVFTLASMLTEEASRVLLVTHVSVLKKTQDFAHDMKMSFPDRIIVKAAISKPIKRYIQERDGNSGILELASIKDAFEIMEKFKSKDVLGYEGSTVEWLADSCDVARPALPYCDCLMCKGSCFKLRESA